MRTRIIAALIKRPIIRVFLVVWLFQVTAALSQTSPYDADHLSAAFHASKREALRNAMPPGTCALLFSNPIRNRTNDVDYQYVQDPDFYYLTGLTEPASALFLFSEPVSWDGIMVNELLFIRDHDALEEMIEGKRAGKAYVRDSLGLLNIAFNHELDRYFPDLSRMQQVWVKWPADIDPQSSQKNSLNWMVSYARKQFDAAGITPKSAQLLKALAALRQIKSQEELVLMKKSIGISVEALTKTISSIEPGKTEYQAQAVAEFYFKYLGAEYPGYGSIAGSGPNSCVLHYTANRKTLRSGDLLVMDMGAEYHGYTADITRTVPVNGRFTPEQKIIYELVLAAQQAAIKLVVAGKGFNDPHYEAYKIISTGLVRLGIIKSTDEAKAYFPHGTSHYLGLEVHDAGNYGPLQPGMIITVEPGIYIPEGSPCDPKWWNCGVRIEDDVLVTDNEPVVLSAGLLVTVEAIEELMSKPALPEEVK
ncbi:MAG TPA: aminopeptidase P family protein [Bacteroidia bacterium]|nr:aminopeptidase P family protein [Bacteroidia bacterium]